MIVREVIRELRNLPQDARVFAKEETFTQEPIYYDIEKIELDNAGDVVIRTKELL